MRPATLAAACLARPLLLPAASARQLVSLAPQKQIAWALERSIRRVLYSLTITTPLHRANEAVGAFGSTTSGFGSKPAFGSTPTTNTTSGGLFGGSSTPSTGTGFGGFGSNTNTTTPSAFGSNTGSGLFGNANKPAGGFGTAATPSPMFGGGNTASNTGTGFGGFGATNTLGGATGDPPGTAVTPFQAFTEKEPNSSTNQSNAFQNILFQDPYKKWSADELRLADYVQGRRHGNPSGTGAFGVGSGFGGAFGNTNQTSTTTGGFGATNNTTGGLFGSNTNTNTASGFGGGFGANNNTAASTTGGGLFGNANKPATGGLFGAGNTTQSQGGGLFGSGNTNTGTSGFGATNTTGGGLFGANNTATSNTGGLFGNNAQNKPANTGFSFGNNTNTASTGFGNTGGGFGSTATNTAGGGLFGNANANTNAQAGGGLFGNTQQQSNTSGGLFGQAQTQQSGGLFGNQPKPATGGLFGSAPAAANTNTGGGLFGNTQQQGTTGLGGAATGGLFGAKPAATGGLFGGSNATAGNTGGGLFGGAPANQTQQTAGTGLFGGATNQQKPGLFGGTTAAPSGGLFGGSTAQASGGLFSNAGNQQQQSIGLGSSLLGGGQQVNNAPQGLTANLSDVSAYGSPSLFSGLGGNEIPNPGPLAVPLSGQPKPKRPSIFPMYKFTPAASGRFGTPQKRGFGFSYSTYGTPAGASPAAGTPSSLGRSLLGSTPSGTALSKSVSSNNLRRNVNTDDSILLPGAFSNTNNTRWYGSTGSKKLVINRELRSDLFSTPLKDKQNNDNGSGPRKLAKRVSFDTHVDGEDSPPVRAALPAPGDVPSSPAEETPRLEKLTPVTNGLRTPEMEYLKSKDKELAIVPEEESATPEPDVNGFDNAPGKYWMEPSREELQNMNRIQRQRIDNFTVGRENVGSITFKIPVDISGIDLDELCGGIIQLEPRSATVYPIAAKKPPVGKGLNVPARISLEQSWPRGGRDRRVASDPKRFNKHIERLKRIVDTTFESYDVDSGVWTFSVEHFTTYGLDDSDEETDFDMTVDPPADDSPPATFHAPTSSQNDDAMVFSQSHMLPGAFDEQEGLFAAELTRPQSFLGVSSADSATHDVKLSLEDDHIAEYEMSEDEDMTRSSFGHHLAAEHDDASSEGGQDIKRATSTPGGILRARMRAMKDSAGPVKLEVADGDDWTEMLRKTVSPMKRDRQLAKELTGSSSKRGSKSVSFDVDEEPDFRKSSIWGRSAARPDRKDGHAAGTQIGMEQGRGFATSIDLMNSLFEKPKPKPLRKESNASPSARGFPKVGTLTVSLYNTC